MYSKPAVPLDEIVIFAEDQPTFHRSFNPALVATEKACYLLMQQTFRLSPRKWLRFPYEQVKSLTITQAPESGFLNTATLITCCVVIAAFLIKGFGDHPWNSSRPVFATVGIFLPVLFAVWWYRLYRKSNKNRYFLILETHDRVYKFITPADTYNDEKLHDYKFICSFADALASQGVQTYR